MGALETLRRRIDALDDRILALLNARARVVGRVYAHKQKAAGGAAVRAFVPAREAEIHRRLSGRNHGPFPSSALRPVFREIISACRSLEGPFRVAYAGSAGSPAHRAALECFGHSAGLVPAGDAAGVRRRLDRGLAGYGVVPISARKGFPAGRFAACVEVRLPLKAPSGRFVVIAGRPSPPAS